MILDFLVHKMITNQLELHNAFCSIVQTCIFVSLSDDTSSWSSVYSKQQTKNNHSKSMASAVLIIIMLAYLYWAAYTRMTMNESSPPCEQKRIAFNDDGQSAVGSTRVSSATRHITFACTGCYQLHPPPHHRLGIITPKLIAGTNLPTPKGWIAWLAKADWTHMTFVQGYYTIESKGTRRKWTQVVGSKTNSIPVNQPRRTL